MHSVSRDIGFDDEAEDQNGGIIGAQIVANLRHTDHDITKIVMPSWCNQTPPCEVNKFCDGSFTRPNNQTWALAAAGLWVPHEQQQQQQQHSNTQHDEHNIKRDDRQQECVCCPLP